MRSNLVIMYDFRDNVKSYHASRTFFVSGHAQQALHFGFSPGAVPVVGASDVSLLADELPIFLFIFFFTF